MAEVKSYKCEVCDKTTPELDRSGWVAICGRFLYYASDGEVCQVDPQYEYDRMGAQLHFCSTDCMMVYVKNAKVLPQKGGNKTLNSFGAYTGPESIIREEDRP